METSRQTNATRLPDSDCLLMIMAKAPRLGVVKTRLAQSLSLPVVTELYCCLLHDTIRLALSLSNVRVAILCPMPDVEDLSRIVGDAVPVVAQVGNGLAAGLTSVFAQFAANGGTRVIAFNSDSPHLPAAVLVGAFEALAANDVVVGPTDDGGYFLVGATASYPKLFADDGMGTHSAFQALQARAQNLRLSVHLTDTFYDVDEMDDLRRLASELLTNPGRAPRTAAWLTEWERTQGEQRSSIGAP